MSGISTEGHVRRVSNNIANDILRLQRGRVHDNLVAISPDAPGQESGLGPAGVDLCTSVLGPSLSDRPLRLIPLF